MEIDPKKLVATGYDRIADRYLDWPAGAEVRRKYMARLLDLIPIGGCVLDLGCGPGVPVAQELSRKVDVWGVDISARQIELARRNVPAARFIESDMMTVDLPAGHFDAVSAFFAITHLPRNQHAGLLQQVKNWLRDGGIFIASMGATNLADAVEPNWLGAPMFFSHFDASTNLNLVSSAGLQLLDQEIVGQEEFGRIVQFLWIVAQKPVTTR